MIRSPLPKSDTVCDLSANSHQAAAMIRSPLPKSDIPTNRSAANRLAAVTRKQKNIEELLRNLNPDVPKIKALYTEYLVKVETFLGACGADVSEEWISARRSVIDAFRLKVENFFAANKAASEHGSHASRSARSSSSRSSTSSVRLRIAQQRAKALAEQAVMEETCEIESKKLELQHRQRRAQAERMRIESDLLEQELNKIDLEDGSASEYSIRSAQPAIEEARLEDLHRSSAVERRTGPFRGDENCSLLAVLAKQNEISSTLSRNQEQAALPKKTLQAFSGDVTEFKVFAQSFDRVIASRCSNDADKLAYLEQFTTGNPHKLVKSCVNSDASTAYRNARDLLSSEYGDEFKVTNAYLEALSGWPAVKSEDAESLSDLYVYLLKCQNYLEDLTYDNPLQNPKEIMAIVMKLPYRLRERWRRQTLHLHQQKKRVEFQHLVAFVREELALIKQPLFGTIADSVNDKKLSTSRSKRVLASSTAAVKTAYCEEQCPCCRKKNHPITSCLFFKEKTFEEKGDFIRKLGLCFGCLGSGHRSRDCSQKLICSICQERHPTVMHLNKGANSNGKGECSQLNDPSTDTTHSQPPITHITTNVVSGPGERRAVMCPVVPAKIRVGGTDKWIVTNVALDSHSTDCWMSGKLQSKLNCRLEDAQVDLSTMGSLRVRTRTRIARDLIISDLHENKVAKAPLIFVKEEKDWPFTYSDVPTIDDVAPYDHLTCVPFDFVDAEIGLLIGMNFPGLMKPTSVVSGGWGEPFATLHWLGWALNGPVSGGGAPLCMRMKTDSLESELDKFFEQDYAEPEDEQLISVEDLVWTKKVEANTKVLDNHHFEISLPFSDEKPKFPNNKQQILLRFQSLLRRFQRDEGYFKEYAAFIRDMLRREYCEIIPANETETKAHVWYLPHHGVFHKQKKKMRVVFDCSHEFNGTSLNQKLMQGPDFTNNIVGVLLRFRQEKICITGDVEKMYYQVRIPAEQSDFMRFFWTNEKFEVIQCRLKVHVFGAKSSPSVANYALRKTADLTDDTDIKTCINRNFYVDDLLISSPSEDVSLRRIQEIKTTLAQRGFRLTGFSSNSKQILEKINAEDLSSKLKSIDFYDENLPLERALGIIWKTNEDLFGYKFQPDVSTLTRRDILRFVASIYDPLGLISPAVILGRKIFQETCRLRLGWDEELPLELKATWKKWMKSLETLSTYEIPRCLKPKHTNEEVVFSQLHIFCDGSETAYGAVAYVRHVYRSSASVSTPVFTKVRLTPLNNSTLRTIPRIELCAAKLAIDVSKILVREMDYNFESKYFWTDSTTVLSYIKNETRRFQRFVSNKVSYVRSLSSPAEWFHVPSSENPADLVSRGATIGHIRSSELWNGGPTFLHGREISFPEQLIVPVLSTDSELRNETKTLMMKSSNDPLGLLLDSTSSWYKLKLRVAWLQKFLHFIMGKNPGNKINTNDVKNAEIAILLHVQRTYIPEYKTCASGELDRKNPLNKLDLFFDDDGLLRVGGRLKNSDSHFEMNHPILLPKSSNVTIILIRESHRLVGHLGRNSVSANLRRKYWVINGNVAVKKVLRECIICKKLQGPHSTQKMADLPSTRLAADVPAFTHVGTDFFGPFIVKMGRTTHKRYGVIFTCMSSRAVHLEVSHSLEANSFLNALRRFICRRGNVSSITSDNGTNFVGGNNELRKSIQTWNQNAIENWLKQRDITWKFNSPHSSHHGGVWERLIRSVRKVLTSLMSEQPIKLSDEGLSTLMCEVEFILNSRPLTQQSDDPNDFEAITPNHLILLNPGENLPPGIFTPSDNYATRRWRQIQYLADLFWTRWRKEYLPSLQQRQKWVTNQRPHQPGDLVLVVDINLPRNQWPLGRVTEAIRSEDGRVRRAKIRISKLIGSGFNFGSTIIERPVTKLILLIPFDEQ